MRDWAELLVARARDEGVELTGEGGLLTGLVRQVLQIGLEVEMTEHLGYERHAVEGRGSPNSRNGTTPKTVTTEIGQVELAVPRDRAGTFAPVTAPQAPPPPRGPVGQRDLAVRERAHDRRDSGAPRRDLRHRREPGDDLEDHRRDRGRHDGVAEPAPRRGLPGAGFDAIVVKVRDAQVANRPVYVAIGVDLAGERDVGGLWLGPAGGEGAKQWATMLTELRNRGLADALIVCCDGLRGACPSRSAPPGPTRQSRPASCTWSATASGMRPRNTGARSPKPCERSLHRTHRGRRRGPPRRVLRRLGRHTPGHDPVLAEQLGRVRAVPGVPRRAAQSRLHHKRHRKPQRPLPKSSPTPRPLTATNRPR